MTSAYTGSGSRPHSCRSESIRSGVIPEHWLTPDPPVVRATTSTRDRAPRSPPIEQGRLAHRGHHAHLPRPLIGSHFLRRRPPVRRQPIAMRMPLRPLIFRFCPIWSVHSGDIPARWPMPQKPRVNLRPKSTTHGPRRRGRTTRVGERSRPRRRPKTPVSRMGLHRRACGKAHRSPSKRALRRTRPR